MSVEGVAVRRVGGGRRKKCSNPVALGAPAAGIVLCPVGAI